MVIKYKNTIVWPVNLLAVLGSISVNIYLPSLPALEQDFDTSSKLLALSISLFLLGYGISQFIWGSLSERFGRKKPVYWGLTLACLGSVIAMTAMNITTLNIARFIEGFGIGCAAVIGRAILTDSFDRKQIAQVASFILIAANVMPAIAPLFGGFLLLWFSWRIIFLFLIFYTLSILFIYYNTVPETHKNIKKSFSFLHAVKEYFLILTDRTFLGYFLINALLTGGLLAYYASTPFIFITILHMSAHTYSFLSLATVSTYILGACMCTPVSVWIGFNQTILLGILMGILSGVTLFLCWLFSSLSIATVILPMVVFSLSVSLVVPNTNAGAMSAKGNMAGAAAAILGAGSSALGAIFAYLLNLSNLSSLNSLARFVSILAVLVLGIYFFVLPKKDPLAYS